MINRRLHSRLARRRGLSLLELITSVVVLAILSVGATNLIVGALRTDRVLLDSNRQVSEIELAIRRLTHNIRTGSAITVPAALKVPSTALVYGEVTYAYTPFADIMKFGTVNMNTNLFMLPRTSTTITLTT